MKKEYIAPTCVNYALPTGKLFTNPASLHVSDDKADQGGWSKKFWGNSVFDDDVAEADDILE